MTKNYQLIVIGGGPGGYVAAIKAAKLGLQTAIVEERDFGGTCLNRGCIPAKALIHASHIYREMLEAERYGLSAENISYDYAKISAYKEDTTQKLVSGVEQLLAANGVDIYRGKGTLRKDRTVSVAGSDGPVELVAEHIILATGSKPLMIPIPGIDLPGVLSSDELFCLKEAPGEPRHHRRRCDFC